MLRQQKRSVGGHCGQGDFSQMVGCPARQHQGSRRNYCAAEYSSENARNQRPADIKSGYFLAHNKEDRGAECHGRDTIVK